MSKIQSSLVRRSALRRPRTRDIQLCILSTSLVLVAWFLLLLGNNINVAPSTTTSLLSELALTTSTPPPRRLGILVGIFTADFKNDKEYRARHRRLFTLWNDPRVCTLHQFQTAEARASCEVIYTFVVGGNPQGPTEWMEQEDNGNPILAEKSSSNFTSSDLLKPDVTRLNIRENMNEGKSQTWFKYAYQMTQRYPNEIHYAMKLDADSILHLHEFFQFAYTHLPPPPYSDNAYVGSLRDKAYWPKKRNLSQPQLAELEGYFGTEFEGVHLYLAGQCYILSANLCRVVQEEARKVRQKLDKGKNTYLEGHEDHDVAAMVFRSPEPVHLVTIGKKQRFWEHPVKGEPRWKRIWHREVARKEGRPFEGKWYNNDSSYETVLAMKQQQ